MSLSQPTFRREGNARLMGASSKEGKRAESPPTFIRGKRQKNQNCLRTLRIKGSRVVFTHGEGISTPHVRHKGQQPSIKCANMTSKLYIFPFFMFLCIFMPFCIFFCGRQKRGFCSYVCSIAMRKSDLHSSFEN